MELSLRKPNGALFEDLSEGDPFRHNQKVYMKTTKYVRMVGDPINSVNLSTGDFAYFPHDEPVEPLRGKFVEE